MLMHKRRCVSVLTLCFFLISQSVFADINDISSRPKQTARAADISQISIPENIGSISKKFAGKEQGRIIFLIQDAHAIVDAQQNIRKIIAYLSKTYGVETVLLEGARDRLEPVLFRSFPDEIIRQRVLSVYEASGELSGAEIAAITQDGRAEFRGMEDWFLYEKNYSAYREAEGNRKRLLDLWDKTKQKLDGEQAVVYGEELKEFQKTKEEFLLDRTSLVDFLLYLSRYSGIIKSNNKNYKDLPNLLKTLGYEKSAKPEQLKTLVRQIADEFRSKYLKELGVKNEYNFYNKYQAFMTGEITAGEMLQYLVKIGAETGKQIKLTRELKKLLGNTETLSEIKGTSLSEELDLFQVEIETHLAKTAGEKNLARKYQKLFIARDIICLQAKFEDFVAYQREAKEIENIFEEEGFSNLIEPAVDFYKSALKRDEAFYQSIEMTKGAAAVVAGGFHTSGVENLLRLGEVSHVVITPKISSLSGAENYSKLMANDVSYKQYLKTTYFDALAKQSVRQLADALPVFDRINQLMLWRNNLVRELAARGRVADSKIYLPYLDEISLNDIAPILNAKVSLQSKNKYGEIIQAELENFKGKTISYAWKVLGANADKPANQVSESKVSFIAPQLALDPTINFHSTPDKDAAAADAGNITKSGIGRETLLLDAMGISVLSEKMGASIDDILRSISQMSSSEEILRYVWSDEFSQKIHGEFDEDLKFVLGETEGVKVVETLIMRIRESVISGSGVSVSGLVDALAKGLDKGRIIASEMAIDILNRGMEGTANARKLNVITNFSRNSSDNVTILSILSEVQIDRLLLLHRRDEKVGRAFNLPGSSSLETLVYDQNNSNKKASEQVKKLMKRGFDNDVIALWTEDLGVDVEGLWTILAEIGRISDPDLKSLAVSAIKHLFLKYSTATKEQRAEMQTNPALVLQDLNKMGFGNVIKFEGKILTVDVELLANMFAARQAFETSA